MKDVLNYCTHAIESLHAMDQHLRAEFPELQTGVERFLAGMLESAVKFILPDNGKLFGDDDFRPELFDLFHLPYPICALEFHASDELFDPSSGLANAHKRIALAFDPHALSEHQSHKLADVLEMPDLAILPERAICIISIYSTKEHPDIWSASTGLFCCDLDQDRPVAVDRDALAKDAMYQSISRRLSKVSPTRHGLPGEFRVFPGVGRLLYRLQGMPEDQVMENVVVDLIDECRTVYNFAIAVNCSNVGTQRIAPPKMLNQKRLKKGKVPFFEYHVLDLAPASSDGQGKGEGKGGSHASPRMHLRRGHIRRLGERSGHRVIWVNATVVGNAAGGAIHKDYRIRNEST